MKIQTIHRRGFIAASVALASLAALLPLVRAAGVEQERAIQIIRNAGGIVVRDRDLPDHPVVTIRYDNVYESKPIDPKVLESVASCREVRELEFQWSPLTDADLRFLTGLRKIRKLCLNRTLVTDAGVAIIAGLPEIEELEISSRAITDAGLKSLATLKRLRILRPGACRSDGTGFAGLKDLPDLQVLDLGGMRTSAALFRELQMLPGLNELDLNCNGEVTDADLKIIAGLPKLRKLVLFANVTDGGLKLLAESPRLRSLWINNHAITAKGIGFLQNLSTLEELQMNVRDEDRLRRAAGIPGLKSVGARRATDATLHELRALTQLRILNLEFAKVTDAGVKELANMKDLEELDLSWNRDITDAGIAELSGLQKLRVLRLGNIEIGNTALPVLQKLTKLRELKLPGRAGDASLEILAGLPELESLNIGCSDISDVGAAKFGRFPSLRKLEIGTSRMTDAGLKSLGDLKNLQNLELWSVSGKDSRITEAGIQQLQDALPYTEVHSH